MFWHGPALSRVERLCMSSFVAHGHEVRLYVYDEPSGVPRGVTLCDANRVLPRSVIFHHQQSGSVAAFADWFRYRLLYEHGGIWADTDVVCLQPFLYERTEVYGWMDENTINNAILGLPAGHRIAAWMIECCEHPNRLLPYDDTRTKRRKLKRRLLLGNRRGNVKWGEYGPYGFTKAARYFGEHAKALPFWHFYPVHYLNWRAVFDASLSDNLEFLGKSRALHLWNEMLRQANGFDKDSIFPVESLFERLCRQYEIS
jgi:hypothetical protein